MADPASYQFNVASYREGELDALVRGLLPSLIGVCGSGGTVAFLFPQGLSAGDQATLAAAVAGYTPAPLAPAQKLDAAPYAGRVLAALTLRLSTQWASISPANQAAIQQVIDAAAAAVIRLLS